MKNKLETKLLKVVQENLDMQAGGIFEDWPQTKGYTDYGDSNGWHETPPQVERCERLHHRQFEFPLDRNRTYKLIGCHQCKYIYRNDSSD